MGREQRGAEPVCDDRALLPNQDGRNITKPQIEFLMEEMNHSLTRYHFISDAQMVCISNSGLLTNNKHMV